MQKNGNEMKWNLNSELRKKMDAVFIHLNIW